MNDQQSAVLFEFELLVRIPVAVSRVNIHELVRPYYIARSCFDYRSICAARAASPTGYYVMAGKIDSAVECVAKPGAKRASFRIILEIYRLDPRLFDRCGILAELRRLRLAMSCCRENSNRKYKEK